jgi:hypothetical protein
MNHPRSSFAQSKVPKMGCGMIFLCVCTLIGNFYFIYYLIVLSKVNKENEHDYEAAVDLNSELSKLSSAPPPVANTNNLRVFRKFSVGEITRHFDNQTNFQVAGWIDNSFGLAGWGGGRHKRQTGTGTGHPIINGRSNVHLNLEGISRDNLTGDGFVAVLEENHLSDKSDIVRVVVPSEPAVRTYIASLMVALGKGFGEQSYRDLALKTNIPALQNAARSDVSYVSDRLNSILRTVPNRRSTVTVIGSELTEHSILAGAIQFENDERWYKLFPVALISKIIEIASINAEKPATE